MDEPGQQDANHRRDRARALRRSATEAEKKLWWHLRRQLPLESTYFRRQVALGPYFLDFACLKHRLVIELDGGRHAEADARRHDAKRTAFLNAQGFRVLRFWNEQVFSEIESVIDTIYAALVGKGGPATLTPCPSPQGRGEGAAGPLPESRPVVLLACRLIEKLQIRTPPNVALMHLLMGAASRGEAEAAIGHARDLAANEGVRQGIEAVAALLLAHPDGWGAVHAITGAVEHEPSSSSTEAALAYWTDSFDRLARIAPEAGVALYALGSPDLLASATAEVVDRLRDWRLIGPATDVLDLGCGIGRFADALAPRVRSVFGLDLSGEMIAEARRRCTRPNVRFERSAGQGLDIAPSGGFDLVLAADVFPYLVQAGGTLAEDHIRDARRVLRPGAGLVILNFSYRGDPVLDRTDVARLAEAHGFDVARLGTHDFRLWDAAAFHLVKTE